jgi:hypothetical protein
MSSDTNLRYAIFRAEDAEARLARMQDRYCTEFARVATLMAERDELRAVVASQSATIEAARAKAIESRDRAGDGGEFGPDWAVDAANRAYAFWSRFVAEFDILLPAVAEETETK